LLRCRFCSACICSLAVDGDPVPVPHWGLALSVDQFHDLAARVTAGGIAFEIEPHLRFKGARLGLFGSAGGDERSRAQTGLWRRRLV